MTSTPDLGDRLRRLFPQTTGGWVTLAVGVVAWGYLLILTRGQLLAVTVWSIPFVLMIAAISTPVRSIALRHLFAFFLIGFGPVFLSALLLQWVLGWSPIEDTIRDGFDSLANAGLETGFNNLNRHFWAPVTEELLKVAPLVALVLSKRSTFKTLAGPVDYAVVAGATGAGFAFAEDILAHVSRTLQSPATDSFALGLGGIYSNLVGADGLPRAIGSGFSDIFSFVFPEMQQFGGAIWAGHGAYALGLGLAIGLGVWAVRAGRTRMVFVVPVAIYLWAVFDHVLANWYAGAGCNRRDLFLCTAANFNLQGRILPIVIVGGVVLGALLSRLAIKELLEKDAMLKLSAGDTDRASYRREGWWGWVDLSSDWFRFLRQRRATAFGAFTITHGGKLLKRDFLATMAVRTRALITRQKLTGAEPPDIPPGAAATMDRVSPFHD